MKASSSQLAARTATLMARVCGWMRSRPPAKWPDPKLTLRQLRTLVFLGHQPRGMSDVARHLGISLSSASSMVDRLAGKKLVERVRHPANQRVVICSLTRLGRREVERFWRIGHITGKDLAEMLGPEELQVVAGAMQILAAAAARTTAP